MAKLMSAPNKQYDPVEVTALSPEEVGAALKEGLAAIAGARTLDELKSARLAHAGDRSPLALANAEIGALPPRARAEAGQRVGSARREIRQALDARQAELETERDQRVLVDSTRDYATQVDLVRASVDFGDPVNLATHLAAVTAPAAINRAIRDLDAKGYRIPVRVGGVR